MDFEKIDGSLEVHSQRCHSWLCPVCREKRGREVRAFLRERVELFEVPKLFTLTIDPKCFNSPLDAYHIVRSKAYIPRLMRFLGISNWFCVLEFQKNGNPHWHILLDVGSLPKVGHVRHYLNLEKVYSLWRDKWNFGEQIRLSQKHTESAQHAVNYICKYLIKSPKNGFPDWMWEQCGIRFFSASKSLGSLSKYSSKYSSQEKDKCDDNLVDDNSSVDSDDELGKHKLSNCLRVLYCGTRSIILSDSHFLGEINLPVEKLIEFDDYFKLSQSEDDIGTVYSSVVMDKHKANVFLDSLSQLDDYVDDFLNTYVHDKAKDLGIEEIFRNYYTVPF